MVMTSRRAALYPAKYPADTLLNTLLNVGLCMLTAAHHTWVAVGVDLVNDTQAFVILKEGRKGLPKTSLVRCADTCLRTQPLLTQAGSQFLQQQRVLTLCSLLLVDMSVLY